MSTITFYLLKFRELQYGVKTESSILTSPLTPIYTSGILIILLYCDIVSAKINNPADSEAWRDKKLFLSAWLSCHFVVFIGHVGSTMS